MMKKPKSPIHGVREFCFPDSRLKVVINMGCIQVNPYFQTHPHWWLAQDFGFSNGNGPPLDGTNIKKYEKPPTPTATFRLKDGQIWSDMAPTGIWRRQRSREENWRPEEGQPQEWWCHFWAHNLKWCAHQKRWDVISKTADSAIIRARDPIIKRTMKTTNIVNL